MEWVNNFFCFLHNHSNTVTERAWSRDYALILLSDFKGYLYSSKYHRQHCTLHAFEQFGELYMHNLDDKHPTR